MNTIIRDNPSLNIRRVTLKRAQPLRVVLDRTLRIPTDAKVLTDGQETVLVHIQPDSRGVALPAGDGGADLNALLEHLGDRGIQELLVEGGPIVWKQFLDEGLVDRAIIIRSNTELGEGPESGLDDNRISSAGLEIVRNLDWGGDSVTLWSRPDLPWPSHDWP